jgi:hypothetical protein
MFYSIPTPQIKLSQRRFRGYIHNESTLQIYMLFERNPTDESYSKKVSHTHGRVSLVNIHAMLPQAIYTSLISLRHNNSYNLDIVHVCFKQTDIKISLK